MIKDELDTSGPLNVKKEEKNQVQSQRNCSIMVMSAQRHKVRLTPIW